MAQHALKTWPEPFKATQNGDKQFEIRHEDDRRFDVGDTLLLLEYVPRIEHYTGRAIAATVTYVARNAWGLPDGVAVLGIRVTS